MNCVKVLVTIFICIEICTGCTSTRFVGSRTVVTPKDTTTTTVTGDRVSLFQKVVIDGGFDVNGLPFVHYNNNGGGEEAGKAAGELVKTILKEERAK